MSIKKSNRMVYQNIHTKQIKGVTDAFDDFFTKEHFDTVIEIGTGNGGFSLYIAKKCNEMKTNFYTFDIKKKIKSSSLEKLKDLGGEFFKEDTNNTNKIKKLIKDSGRTLILNDGDKFTTFTMYGPMLKSGDYMFIHDYNSEKKSIFDGLATWNDFEKGVKEFKLKISSYTKAFEKYLWMCIRNEHI